MDKKLKCIIKDIQSSKGYNIVYRTVHIDKSDKDYLCVSYARPDQYCIRMYNDTLDEQVGTLYYSLEHNICDIDLLMVDTKEQGNGLARFMHDLALGHADRMGITQSFGNIYPMAEIKALSNRGVYNNIKESSKYLASVYKSLGNTVYYRENDCFEYTFECKWESGEKVRSLNLDQKEILSDIMFENSSDDI